MPASKRPTLRIVYDKSIKCTELRSNTVFSDLEDQDQLDIVVHAIDMLTNVKEEILTKNNKKETNETAECFDEWYDKLETALVPPTTKTLH